MLVRTPVVLRYLACFATVMALTRTVHAESPLSPRATARGALAGSLQTSRPAWIAEEASLVELRAQLRAARTWTTVGAGLMAGGIVHAGMLGHRHVCNEPGTRLIGPPIVGSLVAALGFS